VRHVSTADRVGAAHGGSAADLDELTEAFVTASRALVGLAVRSVNAAPVELTLIQHRLLVLLAARGEQPMGALAAELEVNPSNASRLCDRLQRLHLVERHRSRDDARSVLVALTAEGLVVLRAVSEHRRREVRRVLQSLSPEVARGTTEALRRFNEAANEVAEQDWVAPRGAARVPREPVSARRSPTAWQSRPAAQPPPS
jgi:DNA-binding MarR family transcriptional regulator